MKMNFLRSGLTIFIFSLCVVALNYSISRARKAAQMEAEALLLEYELAYLLTIPGWSITEHARWQLQKSIGWPARFTLYYKTSQNKQSFTLTLRIGLEEYYVYRPEFGEIVEKHICC